MEPTKPKEIKLPKELPILPTKQIVVFPYLIAPLVVTDRDYAKMIDGVLAGDKMIGLFAQKDPRVEKPGIDGIFLSGTVGTIIKLLRFPDNSIRFLVQGLARIRIKKVAMDEPYIVARVERMEEKREVSIEIEALKRNILVLFEKVVSLAPYLPDDLQVSAMNIEDPGRLADMIATNLNLSTPQKEEILEASDLKLRLERLTIFLNKELEVLELSKKIQKEAASEMGEIQKKYILREQLKAIQKELGEGDTVTMEVAELKRKIKEANMTPAALEAAQKELDRLSKMNPAAAEYTVSRTYLDWLVSLPWQKSTEDLLDIKKARKILDEDHYDLDQVKERILEYLAVRKLKEDMKGPILCFVGPPGVGKTSLGMSIARAMGRKFLRISLGGMRDEAEIRGHRRTYVGALPGRIIQGIKRAGSRNPIFMLDEVDKIGQDFRGDPASALLEVLDPEQNNSFSDHYLDVPFDLSKVMFITTANVLDPIPDVLLDRMEVIRIPGYTDREKLMIAKRYLIPKELSNHGLTSSQLSFTDRALTDIINGYTKESGLRNLEREIATICRKVAKELVEGERKGKAVIRTKDLHKYLGPVKFFSEEVDRINRVGVAPALAWTRTGGEVMFVEATKMRGNKSLTLTGHMGEVMKESAQAALSYIRSRAQGLGIAEDFYDKLDIHVHVPAGAIPKDGPSAGITIATALASMLTGRKIKPRLAMTGEITLRGEVLPIGGLKEKTLAAHRSGVRTVILPKKNEKDLEEIPEEIRKDVKFIFVDTVDEVLENALSNKRELKGIVTKN